MSLELWVFVAVLGLMVLLSLSMVLKVGWRNPLRMQWGPVGYRGFTLPAIIGAFVLPLLAAGMLAGFGILATIDGGPTVQAIFYAIAVLFVAAHALHFALLRRL